MLLTKQDLIIKNYNDMLYALKGYEPLEERDFFPYATDQVKVLDYELPIALYENLKIKNKKQMIKKHNIDTNIDIQDIFNSIWQHLLNKYNTIFEIDNEVMNIINNVCKERYNFYFTDEKSLLIKCNDVHSATYDLANMCILLARKVLNNKDIFKNVVKFY